MQDAALEPLHVVQAWHQALNQRDFERVLEMSDPAIEIVGPRGSGHGRELLNDWLRHARVSLLPLRTFSRGEAVVVTQRGTWHSLETGDVIGEADVASYFLVHNGRITRYARFDTLETALSAAGLTEADEVG